MQIIDLGLDIERILLFYTSAAIYVVYPNRLAARARRDVFRLTNRGPSMLLTLT